jgi:cytochrome b subunit of formate dehydrogenase
VLLKILYWVAVVAISVALVIGLILFLESRDQSDVKQSGSAAPAGQLRLTRAGSRLTSRANTMIRSAAL